MNRSLSVKGITSGVRTMMTSTTERELGAPRARAQMLKQSNYMMLTAQTCNRALTALQLRTTSRKQRVPAAVLYCKDEEGQREIV
eukprot:5181819-Amphidinium_carterae.1